MVTYVLGAGASRHAGYPLAGELGERLHDWARKNWPLPWKDNIESLREHYHDFANLELILTELTERPKGTRAAELPEPCCGNAVTAITVAIPEYFKSLRQESLPYPDLYGALAHDRIQPKDTILTFNYDLALERALRTEGIWEIADGYGFSLNCATSLPPSDTKVLKLHGSSNWLGLLFNGSLGAGQAGSVWGHRPSLIRPDDFKFLGYPGEFHDPVSKGVGTAGGLPALILLTLHKNFSLQTFFGREREPFWDDIWGQAQQALEQSDKVVMIGYSMPAADERARELLLGHPNTEAEILVFSGSATLAISEDFRQRGFRSVKTSGNSRFEDYLRT